MCHNIFSLAAKKRESLDAPTKIYPKCHPRAHIDVFVDSVKMTIVLTCSKCDRMITTVKVRGQYGNKA
jgi:hypothetical protein